MAGNWWFIIIASTFLIAIVGTLVTDRITELRLAPAEPDREAPVVDEVDPDTEARGLRAAGIATLVLGGLLLAALVPEGGVLRNPETGSILRSPFISGVVVVIAFWAALAGITHGCRAGTFTSGAAVVESMERTMAAYLVLMFFAAQFGWTRLGVILAVIGADALGELDPGTLPLMVVFVVLAAGLNLFIASASAKWAIMAAVFVPMLYLLGWWPSSSSTTRGPEAAPSSPPCCPTRSPCCWPGRHCWRSGSPSTSRSRPGVGFSVP